MTRSEILHICRRRNSHNSNSTTLVTAIIGIIVKLWVIAAHYIWMCNLFICHLPLFLLSPVLCSYSTSRYELDTFLKPACTHPHPMQAFFNSNRNKTKCMHFKPWQLTTHTILTTCRQQNHKQQCFSPTSFCFTPALSHNNQTIHASSCVTLTAVRVQHLFHSRTQITHVGRPAGPSKTQTALASSDHVSALCSKQQKHRQKSFLSASSCLPPA